MSEYTIYHNPRCSKSRKTLELLREEGVEPEIIEYLKTPPDRETLDHILTILDIEPADIVRKKESTYTDLGLGNKSLSRSEWIELLVKHPILIERPIVVRGERAVLGRPPENIIELARNTP